MRGRPKEEKTKKHEGDIMVDPDALNALIENYLDRVDDLITAYRMDPKRGTDVLDPIQEEVDGTIDRLRMNAPHSTVSTLRLDSNRSLERLENTLCAITNQNLSGLGTLPAARSVSDNSVWAVTCANVTAKIAAVTDRFSNLLVNMDANRRNQYDTNFSYIIDQGNVSMQKNNSDEAAAAYLKWANGEISKIERSLVNLQNQSAAEMLQVLLQEKDAERLSLLSQTKSIEKSLSIEERQVVNMHNKKAMEILQEMAKNQTTYDATVRDRKFGLIDKHLANIQRLVQTKAFSSNMGGGMFTTPKNLSGIHRQRENNAVNFVPKRTRRKSAPPPNTRAGKMGNLGSAHEDELGVFDLTEPELARPYGERAVKTAAIVAGLGAVVMGARHKMRK